MNTHRLLDTLGVVALGAACIASSGCKTAIRAVGTSVAMEVATHRIIGDLPPVNAPTPKVGGYGYCSNADMPSVDANGDSVACKPFETAAQQEAAKQARQLAQSGLHVKYHQPLPSSSLQ